MATIEIPFAIGATVWHATTDAKHSRIQCPDCLGTRVVTVTLATGEEYTLKCNRCGPGYEPSCGSIEVVSREARVELVELASIELRNGEAEYYRVKDGGIAYVCDLFSDKDAALARAEELRKEQKKNNEKQEIAILTNHRERYAWSVHYWRRQRAKLLRDLESVEGRLGLSIERAKKRVCAADKKAGIEVAP